MAIGMVLQAAHAASHAAGHVRAGASPRSTSSSLRAVSSTSRSAATADEVGLEQAEADFDTEGVVGSTFLAFVDDQPVRGRIRVVHARSACSSSAAPRCRAARGRGAYRALVAARAREAAERGTPVLVTHAGQMSRPILERLGFEPVARIDRLLDVF